MAPFFNTTEILVGKAAVFQRAEGGNSYWRYWIPAEGNRVVQSLKTKDLGAAVQIATERTLDAMSRNAQARRSSSGTLRDAINADETKQMSRLERGEIRSLKKQRQNVADLRSNCEARWGLDTPLSSMTQEKWDEYNTKRKGIKLWTLKSHLQYFRTLIRHHGLSLVAPLIPNFDHVVVPKEQRSRRKETITEEHLSSRFRCRPLL